eukprot:2838490-Prymnesium_polylepis.1
MSASARLLRMDALRCLVLVRRRDNPLPAAASVKVKVHPEQFGAWLGASVNHRNGQGEFKGAQRERVV